MNGNGKDFWRWIAISIAGCLISAVGTFVATGAQRPTRAEMLDMLETRGPWVRERTSIITNQELFRQKLISLEASIDSMDKKLTLIYEAVREPPKKRSALP